MLDIPGFSAVDAHDAAEMASGRNAMEEERRGLGTSLGARTGAEEMKDDEDVEIMLLVLIGCGVEWMIPLFIERERLYMWPCGDRLDVLAVEA